jgi:hypothetical protein
MDYYYDKKYSSFSSIKVKESEKISHYITKSIKTIEFTDEGKELFKIDKITKSDEKEEIIITNPAKYRIKIESCCFDLFNLKFKLFENYAISYNKCGSTNSYYIKSIHKRTYDKFESVFIIKLLNISYKQKLYERFILPLCNSDISRLINNNHFIINNKGLIMDESSSPVPDGNYICPDCEKCFILIPYKWFYNPHELEKFLFEELS